AINRKFLTIAMQLQIEPVGKQILQHLRNLRHLRSLRQLRRNLKPLPRQPIGSRNLIKLYLVSLCNVLLERQGAVADLRTVNMQADLDAIRRRLFADRLDGGHLKFYFRLRIAEGSDEHDDESRDECLHRWEYGISRQKFQ